jgi:hypothetical protein
MIKDYLPYDEYWSQKGEYGKERVRRKNERKEKRRNKSIEKRQYKRLTGSWYDPNSPTGYSQNCDYFGTCQSPCNGDC